jgi:hypothetical protein
MMRGFHILLILALLAVAAGACKNSNNVLRNPDSDYAPSAHLPTNAL